MPALHDALPISADRPPRYEARARQQRVAREGAVAGAGAAPPGGAPGAPGGGAGAPAPLHRRRAHHLRQGLAEGEELTLPWLPAREGEDGKAGQEARTEENTSELQSLMRNSYAVYCLKKKKKNMQTSQHNYTTHNIRKLHIIYN